MPYVADGVVSYDYSIFVSPLLINAIIIVMLLRPSSTLVMVVPPTIANIKIAKDHKRICSRKKAMAIISAATVTAPASPFYIFVAAACNVRGLTYHPVQQRQRQQFYQDKML